jgi:hypothetical protein
MGMPDVSPSMLDLLAHGADIRLQNGTVLEGWPTGYPPRGNREPCIRAGYLGADEKVHHPRFFDLSVEGLAEAMRHVRILEETWT